MGTVEARIWKFDVVRSADGVPGVEATELAKGKLSVSLARLVHINALACDFGKSVDYRVRVHEARLLTSYLTSTKPNDPLNVDHLALKGSSSHIRRFVSECAALGILTASCESLFSWTPGHGALHSFDVLPAFLKSTYKDFGVRPDLLFHLPNGPMAGEARGRHRRAKTLFPKDATAEQQRRLLELAEWSAKTTDHPYLMS